MIQFVNTGLDDMVLKSLNAVTPDEDLCKAMNKQGMVQKEVQVRGKNGTFTRKQWVRASDVQSNSDKPSVKQNSEEKKPKLSDVQGYGFDPATATGDPTYLKIGDKGFYKIGKNKWQYSSSQSHVLGGTYTDAQISDMISSSSEEVKVWESNKKNGDTTIEQKTDSKSSQSSNLGKTFKLKAGSSKLSVTVVTKEQLSDGQKEHGPVGIVKLDDGKIYDYYNVGYVLDSDAKLVVNDSYTQGQSNSIPSGEVQFDLSSDEKKKKFSSRLNQEYRIVNHSNSNLPDHALKSVKSELNAMIKIAKDAGYSINYNKDCELVAKKSATQSDKTVTSQNDSSTTSTSSISFDLPSGKNTKQAVTDLLASHSKSDIMSAAKSAGITWKENAHEGINWMRASMAIQKYMSK